jgi:hypothetical protein
VFAVWRKLTVRDNADTIAQSMTEVAARPVGRPPKPISEETIQALETWIAQGKTLRDFCRQDGMPCVTSLYVMLRDNESVYARIAFAREIGYDCIAAECISIADDASDDYVTQVARNGSERTIVNREVVQRSALRVDTRLKLLAKWDPRRYGEKMNVSHDHSVTITLATGIPRDLTAAPAPPQARITVDDVKDAQARIVKGKGKVSKQGKASKLAAEQLEQPPQLKEGQVELVFKVASDASPQPDAG